MGNSENTQLTLYLIVNTIISFKIETRISTHNILS